jgi:hypothetical protein
MKRVARLVCALALAGGLVACGSTGSGTETTAAEEPAEVVKIAVIGPNADGKDSAYVAETEYALADVADAWDLSQKAFDSAELTYDASNSDYGVMLNSITSPVDGTVLAYDEGAGTYWQLFVDGAASEVGIDGVELADGTSIVWYYSAFGDELPEGELPLVEQLADAA